MNISLQNVDITISFTSSTHETFCASTQLQLSFECPRDQLMSSLQNYLRLASADIMKVFRGIAQGGQEGCTTIRPDQNMAQNVELSDLNLSAAMDAETKYPAFQRFDFNQIEISCFIEFLMLNGYVTLHGRPYKDLEATLNGIFFVLRAGCPWRDMPECYGKWNTAYRTFKRLSDFGAFEAFSKHLTRINKDLAQKTGNECLGSYLDPTVIRVHQHGSGARHDAPGHENNQAIGRSKGGLTTKIHALCDDNINLRNGVLTPGQVHDSRGVEPVMEDVKHGEYKVCTTDKAYADPKVRAQIEAKGAVQCVPPKSNTKNPWEYDKEMYKNRNKIERLFCSLKGGFRRIATRYDKLSSTFLSMVYFGAAIRAMRSSIIGLELLKIYA